MLNARSILILSLGANLLLGAWLWTRARRGPEAAAPHPVASASAEAAAPSVPRLLRTNLVEYTTNVVDAAVSRWAQVETNDYRAYVANLRAIGCPERTIRALLLPDIHKAFARRAGELDRAPEAFWENAAQSAARQRQKAGARLALAREERAFVRELLGIDYTQKAWRMWVEEEELAIGLGFLTEDKVLAMAGAVERLEHLHESVEFETRNLPGDDDIEQIRQAVRAVEQEAFGHLAPVESEEVLLRALDALQAATGRAQRLRGVELSGFEYRQLVQLSVPGPGWVTELAVNLFIDEEEAMESIARRRPDNFEAGARALLGEQRYAAYQRSQDPAFQEALQMADRGKLPESAALQAYDVRQAVLHEARRLAADASLTPEQHKAALDAMHQATVAALKEIYGEKDADRYARGVQREASKAARPANP